MNDAPPDSGGASADASIEVAPEARPEGFVPGARLAGLAALGLPLALLDGGSGLGLLAAAGFDGVLGLGAFAESRGLKRRTPVVSRALPTRLVVATENEVVIRVHNPHDVRAKLVIRDTVPPGFHPEPAELRVDLPAYARRELRYRVTPPRRGVHRFGDLHVRLDGLMGLAAERHIIPAAEDARVYPGVLGAAGQELLTRLSEPRLLGQRDIRALGGGGEFAQLREYVPGDPFRTLDWKSTAKRRRPVTRVFQQERSQSIMLCVDVGRMMAAQLDEGGSVDEARESAPPTNVPLTKLDHAVKAALLLGWVALRGGDRVGLIVFGDGVKAFVPPRQGLAHYRRLLEALFDVQAEPTFVDFRRLVNFIQTRVKRRSLLVIFSDLLDEHHAMPLADNASILRRKHLPLCVTIHDPVAERLAHLPIERPEDLYSRTAAVDLLADRERVKAHLRKGAVDLVEAPVGDLAVATVRRYLQIKSQQRL